MALANTRDPDKSAAQLTEWLANKLPGATGLAVTDAVTPQSSGLSNETLMFTVTRTDDGGPRRTEYVARVAPQGPGVFPRYDLVTEQRVLAALHAHTDAPVPYAPWVETDTAVLGSAFLVMERLPGRIAADDPPYTAAGWVLDLTPDQRAVMCDNALVALTRVHAADHVALGLGGLDRPELGPTPLDQQIADWRATYSWAAEGEINPTVEAGFTWIEANRPTSPGPTILNWGDARLGNVLIGDDLSVEGLLDWEMVTLGPAEMDLGWWLLMVRHHTEGIGLPLPDGCPDRDTVISRYIELTGHQVQNIDFWETFAALRLSILMHRAGNMMIAGGMLPPDAPMKFNNPASQLLARFIGAPPPTGTAQSFIGNR